MSFFINGDKTFRLGALFLQSIPTLELDETNNIDKWHVVLTSLSVLQPHSGHDFSIVTMPWLCPCTGMLTVFTVSSFSVLFDPSVSVASWGRQVWKNKPTYQANQKHSVICVTALHTQFKHGCTRAWMAPHAACFDWLPQQKGPLDSDDSLWCPGFGIKSYISEIPHSPMACLVPPPSLALSSSFFMGLLWSHSLLVQLIARFSKEVFHTKMHFNPLKKLPRRIESFIALHFYFQTFSSPP